MQKVEGGKTFRGRGKYVVKKSYRFAKPINLFCNISMLDAPKDPQPTPKWLIIILLVIFIGSAAWGAYVMVVNEEKYGAPKPKDPLEDRSLFGR
jgi:hypothetical protein